MKVKPLKIWVIQLASLIQRNIYKNYYILSHKENYNTFRKTNQAIFTNCNAIKLKIKIKSSHKEIQKCWRNTVLNVHIRF